MSYYVLEAFLQDDWHYRKPVTGIFSKPMYARKYLTDQGWVFNKRANGYHWYKRGNGDKFNTLVTRITRHEVDALLTVAIPESASE